MIGTTLSHYKIEAELGRGGIELVFCAQETSVKLYSTRTYGKNKHSRTGSNIRSEKGVCRQFASDISCGWTEDGLAHYVRCLGHEGRIRC